MRAVFVLCWLLPTTALAGVFGPSVPPFVPVTHPDGSMTWTFTMDLSDLKYLPKEDRQLAPSELHQKLVGATVAHHKVCPNGWEITDSRTDKKRLVIEGRCL
jgi:hypothetical protein